MPISADGHLALQTDAEAAATRLGRRRDLLSLSRLVVFLGVIVMAVLSAQVPQAQAALVFAGLAALLGGFFALGLAIGVLDQRRGHQQRMASYHRRGAERCGGSFAHGQDDGATACPAAHPFARDLDLVGAGGLYSLLNTAGSRLGSQALLGMLLDLPDHATALRQAGEVRALEPHHAWRAGLAAAAGEPRNHRPAGDAFAAWLANRRPLPGAWCDAVAWALRVAAIVAIAACTRQAGVEGFWLGLLVTGLLLLPLGLVLVRRQCPDLDAEAEAAEANAQADALSALAAMPGATPALDDLRRQAATGAQAMRDLARVFAAHAQRANPIWRLLSSVLVIEWRNLRRLHAWADRHGADRAGHLAAIGRGEALSCLATYAAEQGGAWPDLVAAEGPVFAAEDLAHPLLPRDRRVGNDIVLRDGQVLLLTGANASGKSTYLRAIALALVLARLGAPVCARSCRLAPMRLATVMRVSDDLVAGRSRFQAEVEALRRTLDLVADRAAPALVVLDEILGGTNSRERHLGTKAILDHLRGHAGAVLVSTHDLDLARLAEAEPSRFLVAHFADRAVLGEAQSASDVVFDYRLRPGVLASTNALRVMRAAGLPVAEG